jgi:hypothetical protein
MGKAKEQRIQRRGFSRLDHGESSCDDVAAPICECCSLYDKQEDGPIHSKQQDVHREEEVKELVVIGAGPHSMAMILRLLQPDADLMSEKERHIKAEHHSKKLRPIREVRQYVRDLSRGTATILKKKGSKLVFSKDNPPPIDLIKLRKSVLVIDKSTPTSDRDSGWLSHWNKNFDAIQIPYLRSPTTAHADPFDHRSLDIYADMNGRNKDLVSLELLKQRDREFHGPYQAPSTSLFKDFHSALGKAYGIDDMVQSSAEVESIVAKSGTERIDQEPYFEVQVRRVNQKKDGGGEDEIKAEAAITVKARRVVCALGPMFRTGSAFWEQSLPETCRHRLLHCHEIMPWLLSHRKHHIAPSDNDHEADALNSLLIVGGGITSTHLSLLAARAPWCKSVTVIQRSRIKERQFDIDNKWMGPLRGKFLDEFWSLNSSCKVQFLKEARKGGSIPPELARKLLQTAKSSRGKVQVKQEVQITEVDWTGDQFRVQLDDGSPEVCFDMIWLATGADNDIELYQPLQHLIKDLPIDVAGGLPVLDSDLSWKRPSSNDEVPESPWKGTLRRRLHVMGCLAGLQLGPDALNVIGARHGAVRVAKAIRLDMYNKKELLKKEG